MKEEGKVDLEAFYQRILERRDFKAGTEGMKSTEEKGAVMKKDMSQYR